MGDVSGCYIYPTRVSAHVLPDQSRHFRSVVICVGKQLFGVNPCQYWLCALAGKIWGSGLQPHVAVFAAMCTRHTVKSEIPRVPAYNPYSLDNIYPSLVAYAEVYQQCGQVYTKAGVTFWGDMHATFTLNAQGEIDSLNATYPAATYMRPFLDCASTAFKKLSFPPTQNHQTVYLEALIQVQPQNR